MLPDLPILTPNTADSLGYQPPRASGNGVHGSWAASCGHRGVVPFTASLVSLSQQIRKAEQSHPEGRRAWGGVAVGGEG